MKTITRTGRVVVSVLLLLVIIAFSLMPIIPARATEQEVFHSEWVLIREIADEDGADFSTVYDLTLEGNFANKDSSTVVNGGPYQISPRAGVSNRWMFAICAKNYDIGADNIIDNTLSFNLIGWSRDNGMLQVIAEGDCVLGTQAVIVYPDTGDAAGALVDESAVAYDFGNEKFTVTNEAFAGVVAGMMAYITSDDGAKLTSGYYAVTTATDSNNIVFSGISSSADTTARVQMNPAFWADTISLDETTKWTSKIDGTAASSGNKGVLEVINSSDNEVAGIVVDLSGIDWIQFVVYDALPAQTGEAGDVTVYGRKF